MGIIRYNATRQLARLRSPVIVPPFRQLQRRPYAAIMTKYPEFQDVMGCQAALFEWADSYDAKDWDRLRECVAPSLMVDYRAFLNKKWDDMPADEFVQMASDSHFLGNKMIKTQHFHGGSRYEQESDDKIIGHHQMRVAHQKYADESLQTVVAKGHGHGTATIWYKKVDGVWKFAGLIPNTRWTEYDFHKIFHHDAESEGESSGPSSPS